ncbi:MAG: class I SAM-dependent methyltransferase [Paludibacteraceae bacterium]|nr:class I SAM-dependent methyltransferase [Paludibacteraceae bacterium]
MNKSAALHRILSYIKHVLTAWNTTGEGIHSPYLFRIVRFILRDENTFYCFADIERRREQLLACPDVLDVLDFGSQGAPEGKLVQRRVCDIAKNHLESPKVGQILFHLLHFMGQEEHRPLHILELGTSLGITTAYLASVSSRNKVLTFEGSEAVLRVAQGVWRTLRLENIQWQQGNIDDTLYTIYSQQPKAKSQEPIDLAFVDANHTYEATKRYVEWLMPRMTGKGILVLDDIHYSKDMERAWQELKADERVTTTMDLYHIGLLFFDPHYLKRHYRIRI